MSLMSFLSETFSPIFVPVQLGGHQLLSINDYIDYMKTPSTAKDPFKWGGFLEILAASIMYSRPIHVHVMDIKPEFRICYDNSSYGNI